ncbi:MAG: winged helix-turn-helix domain-containing protein [Cyclobacteriaceae bacterium]
MNKFKNAALRVLTESKSPLHYKEITRLALQRGYLKTEGKTPEASMNAQLITEVNALGTEASFIKTSPATFSLNPNRTKIESKQKREKQKVEREKVSGGFIGKAGEHYVTSELLFRGFNASIMSVDVGMDVIATKSNRLFSLQVKTANISGTNTFEYDVRKVALTREYTGNVFYVFVMNNADGIKSAVILPANKVDELIHSNAIKEVKSYDKFRVTLKVRNDEIYIGTKENPIDYYWNNWDVIK